MEEDESKIYKTDPEVTRKIVEFDDLIYQGWDQYIRVVMQMNEDKDEQQGNLFER